MQKAGISALEASQGRAEETITARCFALSLEMKYWGDIGAIGSGFVLML
ncbi:MAG: hypothetical protein AAF889_02740 [Cyanobacteria bacterium P01_D01_bin.73]